MFRRLGGRIRRRLVPEPSVPTDGFAAFGPGSYIQPPAEIGCPHRIHIGANVLVRSHAWLALLEEGYGQRYDPELRVGDGTWLGHNFMASCVGEITIGEKVLISDRVFVLDSYHEYEDPTVPIIDQPMAPPRPVVIKDGAFVGAGAVVLSGVTIGENAYVGANSVVTRDVPARTVVVGNPARVVRRWQDGRWVDE